MPTLRFLIILILAPAASGCIVAGIPVNQQAYLAADWSERKLWEVCTYGKERPDLLRAVEKEFDRYGIDFAWRRGPEKYAGLEPDWLFLKVTPECRTHLILRLPSGFGMNCVLAVCQAALTYARRDRLDSVMVIDWGVPKVVTHEFYHAAGCVHAKLGEGDCVEQLQILRSRLPPTPLDRR